LDSTVTQVGMGIVTIYALFGDDIRVLSTNTYGDPVFWSLNAFCLGAFTLEIVLTCIAKVSYHFGINMLYCVEGIRASRVSIKVLVTVYLLLML